LVSETDLLHCILKGADEQTLKAKDLMQKEVITVNEDTPLKDVIKTLEDNNLVRVPVVKNNVLVGIITRRDLLLCHMKATAEPPHWI
jgi:CBS domain-containing protein